MDVILRLCGYTDNELYRMSKRDKEEKVEYLKDFVVDVVKRIKEDDLL